MSHGVSFGLIVNGDEPPDRDPLEIVDAEIEGAIAARDAAETPHTRPARASAH